MKTKQVLALFFCSLVPWTIGNGLIPLLPVYATRLGATPTSAGNYLSLSYLAIAVGAFSAGWVSDRSGNRRLPIILTGLLSIPLTWLMGHASSVGSLTILTALVWLFGGLGLALISILAGLSAGRDERGKIFGLLALTGGLGAFIGGLTSGYIVDHWGFTALFSILAVFLILWPVSAFFLSETKPKETEKEQEAVTERAPLGRSFHLLFSASLISSSAGFFILLGRSLMMSDLGFSATAISITGAVSGLIAMPLPLLMGWLSDRTGRKPYLYLAYLAGMIGLILLPFSTSLAAFVVVAILQAVFTWINGSVGNALVTDILPPQAIGRGLASFGATAWIGGILGFAVAGYLLQHLGVLPTFVIGAFLPLIAIFLLIPVRPRT